MNGVDIAPRRLTWRWPDVGFFILNREPADVDRIPVAREVTEDRGPFRECRDGRRPARGASSPGTAWGPFSGTWPARSVNCNAVFNAGTYSHPRVSRFVPPIC